MIIDPHSKKVSLPAGDQRGVMELLKQNILSWWKKLSV